MLMKSRDIYSKLFIFTLLIFSIHIIYIGIGAILFDTGSDDLIYRFTGIRRRDQFNTTASLFIISATICILRQLIASSGKLDFSDKRLGTLILFNLVFANFLVASLSALLVEFHPQFWIALFSHIFGVVILFNAICIFMLWGGHKNKPILIVLVFLNFAASLSLFILILDDFLYMLLYAQVLSSCVVMAVLVTVYSIAGKQGNNIKAINYVLLAMAIIPFSGAVFDQTRSAGSIETDEYSNFKFTSKPDIYLVSIDALIPSTLAKAYLSIDRLPYEEALFEGGHIFRNAFSSYARTYLTLNSVMRLANPKYLADPKYPELSENYFYGQSDSPIARIFRENGYNVRTGTRFGEAAAMAGPFISQPKLSEDTSIADSRFCVVSSKANYALFLLCPIANFINKGHLFPDLSDRYKKLIVEYQSIEDYSSPQLKYFYASNITSHVGTSFRFDDRKMIDEYSIKYENDAENVYKYLSEILNSIRKKNRKSIVFVFGDHGAFLSNSIPFEKDPNLVVTDKYGVFASIALNTSTCPTDKFSYYKGNGYITPERVLASIIRCLTDNKNNFDSIMNFKEEHNFSEYLYE